MSKFNTASVTHKATNLAGGTAYKESPELRLVSALLTSFLEDKYYEKGKDRIAGIADAVRAVDPKFGAQAALYARNEFGMRSVSHVAAAELASRASGMPWASSFYDKIVRRPDDMLEILSYYKKETGKAQTHAMRKGFATALTRFDNYQLAKYRSAGKEIKLVDVMNITHPRANASLTALIKDELRNRNTTEAQLSEAGQSKDNPELAKAEAWYTLVMREKIGYMALLKNLRNIIEQAPEVLDKALQMLTDEKRVKNSLVLPFRYLDAAAEISKLSGKDSKKVLMALNTAMDISAQNIPTFDGETLVAVDSSGSMTMGYGNRAQIEHAALFAAMLVKSNMADVLLWDDEAVYLSCNPQDSVLSIATQIESAAKARSRGTNIAMPFRAANRSYDRIVILTDEQSWGHSTYVRASNAWNIGYQQTTGPSELEAYKRKYNAHPFVYNWDLAGHGTLQFPENQVATLAGWSDKVFDIMKLCETDKKALINTIKAVEL
jgi:60 kDa SS-A/Ro ribonucleoprotein